ncbi:MAG: zinc ribbon domain-containing protein [Phycisphaerales bacterium]|jgi:uncharacterized protein (DUF983 family)|nr:zinc ribbon domain-containing protein [Phycisphaerales bacterium]
MPDEGPSQEDIERFSRNETGFCPNCGEEVWDDSTQCNSCGFWLQEGTSSRHPVNDIFRKQSFAIIGVIVIIAFFWGLWRFF